jgi:hypothetical protein
MAKIERSHQKVFCNSVAATDNVAQFGSLKAAAIQFSKDPAVIQALAAYEEGWKSAVVTNNAPALQDMNALFYLLSRQTAYTLQAGIPEWNTNTVYYLDDYCRVGSAVYCSLANDNTGFAVTDTSKWVKVFEPNTSGGVLGSVPLGSVIAIGNTQAWALPTADQVKDGFALCNGNTFAALGAGNYNAAFTGSRPQISDNRFLMGSTTVGATGGQNSTTLAVANIPQMSGTFGSNATGDHTHTFSGSTGAMSANATHAHLYDKIAGAGTGGFGGTANISLTQPATSAANTDHTHAYSGTTSGSSIGNHTHSTTVTLGTASPTAIENRPSYFSVVYVMRVK